MSVLDVSLVQALSIWGELVEAFHGVNGWGGDTAEIYAYRLMPYSPSVHSHGVDVNGEKVAIERRARAALADLVERFAREHDCGVLIDGRPYWEWREAATYDHRAHVRVVPRPNPTPSNR